MGEEIFIYILYIHKIWFNLEQYAASKDDHSNNLRQVQVIKLVWHYAHDDVYGNLGGLKEAINSAKGK